MSYGENEATEDTTDPFTEEGGANGPMTPIARAIVELYQKYLKRTPSNAEIVEASRSGSLEGLEAGILDSPEYKALQPVTPPTAPPTTPPPGNGYNLERLKAGWLAWTGPKTPAGLQEFLDANNKNGGFATGVTRIGSKLNQLSYDGKFIAKVIGSTDANPYLQWNENPGETPPPPPPPPGGTSATPAETPAQRAARLAGLGLGPGGLQNQRPGAPPPRPGQMGDMMGRRPQRFDQPYDPSGGRGVVGPDQGGRRRQMPDQQPYDPSGGFEPGGFTGRQQGGGYQPVEDPGMYTPGEAYQAPEYRAPDPYQQATPFSRDEYQAATPFGRPEYQGATPFSRDEYQAATPFAAPTAADMAQDPGYQFRLSQGQKALERSGAARGVTNTGGNMKGLLDYGQQAASQEYGNVYGRNLTTYNTNEANRASAYNTNYGNAFGAYNTNEANRAGAYQTNYSNAAKAYDTNEANRAGAYQTNYGNALTAYNTNEANRAGAYNTNANNAYQQYTTNALAKNAYNQETESRRSGAFATNSNLYQQRQQDAYNRSQQAYNDAMAEYQSGINNQRNYERDRMSDLFRVAGI